MKAILNHIAIKKVAKRVDLSIATKLGDFLREEGYTKQGRVFAKGHHQFVFNGSGQHWTVSHRRAMEVAS